MYSAIAICIRFKQVVSEMSSVSSASSPDAQDANFFSDDVPVQAGKAQVLARRRTTLVVITWTSNRKETGMQGVVSLCLVLGVGLFPEAGRPEQQH